MRRFLLLTGLLLLLAPVFGATPPEGGRVVHENALTRQELSIARTLRCTVCQNESVADSKAGIAKDMRALIRQQLRAGKSRKQIVAYFVSRYGDYILLKPPFDVVGTVVWVLPLFLLAVLALSGWLVIRRHSRATETPPPQLTEEDLARVRAARQQD
ncbi:MAG: cytochrome c-type biogenesis protein CcmH [Gammaproteobacteria bacterium]|nr:cytochrome c-type biogenesis protein CcmH [Gammaproteobacteria bacterium]